MKDRTAQLSLEGRLFLAGTWGKTIRIGAHIDFTKQVHRKLLPAIFMTEVRGLFRQAIFSDGNTPTVQTSRFNVYRGGKPYEQHGNQETQPVVPIGIPFPEGTPLDRQVIPGPPPELEPRIKLEPQPNAPESKEGALIIDGKRVLIPTFDLSDPVLDSKNRPKVQEYDINSPEAKLYLENRDSIVKITTNKMGADGKIGNAWASGFFVNENGQIATADHVVDGAVAITVTTAEGKTYDARVVQRHTASESAVIQLTNAAPGEKFRPIPFARQCKHFDTR